MYTHLDGHGTEGDGEGRADEGHPHDRHSRGHPHEELVDVEASGRRPSVSGEVGKCSEDCRRDCKSVPGRSGGTLGGNRKRNSSSKSQSQTCGCATRGLECRTNESTTTTGHIGRRGRSGSTKSAHCSRAACIRSRQRAHRQHAAAAVSEGRARAVVSEVWRADGQVKVRLRRTVAQANCSESPAALIGAAHCATAEPTKIHVDNTPTTGENGSIFLTCKHGKRVVAPIGKR